ncbi:MAG TPA: transposase [Bacilli bacterium]|nr:transposase [Bacilli bacterium]
MAKNRKTYEIDFKVNTVELILQSNKSTQQIAEEMDLNYHTVLTWVREYKKYGANAFSGRGVRNYKTQEEEEIARLKEELQRVKMERDILKKAAAIFSRENS